MFLTFTDSITAGPFDLVVGADGIRSAVRQHIFPDHHLSYTGKVAYRVLIPQEKVAHIPDVPKASVFWHTPTTHVYTCPLDNGLFEIATRAIEDEEYGSKVSWGRTVTKDRVVPHYEVSPSATVTKLMTRDTVTRSEPLSTRRTSGSSLPFLAAHVFWGRSPPMAVLSSLAMLPTPCLEHLVLVLPLHLRTHTS